jgi:AcrR family transcriptional regulator
VVVSSAKQSPVRTAREDGLATRRRIIECAGALFAERGYAETSSKQITESAGVNVAAVNYYFGSREKLYTAVLEEVDRRLIGLDVLTKLDGDSLSAEATFARIVETITAGMSDRGGWPAMLWAREILNPSPMFADMLRDGVEPKFEFLARVISDITGLTDRAAVLQCLVISLAPCVLLASINPNVGMPIAQLRRIPAEELSQSIVVFALAGLHAYAEHYRGSHP